MSRSLACRAWVLLPLLLGGSAPAARIALSTATVAPGGTATLSLGYSAEGASVSTILVDALFPSSLSYTSVARGPAAQAAGKDVSTNPVSGGVRLLVTALNDGALGDGALASVTFSVASGTSVGTIPVTLANASASSPEATSVTIQTSDGAVIVSSGASVSATWVPVAVHAAGLGGSQWRTDVGVLNRGSAPASLEMRLYDPGGLRILGRTVAPGALFVMADAAYQFNSFEGSAPLEIRSTEAVSVSARVYNQVSAGTFGATYQCLQATGGLASGRSALLIPLREDAAFRTNIGMTNAGSVPASVNVTLYEGNGQWLGSYQVTLSPGEFRQETQPFRNRAGRGDLDRCYAKLDVVSGSGVIAYGSVIDNSTGDPTSVFPVE